MDKSATWTQRVSATTARAKTKATWAAAALAGVSLLAQITNFVRSDLKPVLDGVKQVSAKLDAIEKRLEDHENRLRDLERGAGHSLGGDEAQEAAPVVNDRRSVKPRGRSSKKRSGGG